MAPATFPSPATDDGRRLARLAYRPRTPGRDDHRPQTEHAPQGPPEDVDERDEPDRGADPPSGEERSPPGPRLPHEGTPDDPRDPCHPDRSEERRVGKESRSRWS